MSKSIMVLTLSVVLITGTLSPAFASPIFVYDPGMSLEQSIGTDTLSPQVAVNGDDIYVFYRGSTAPNDIMEFDTVNIAAPSVHTSFDLYDGFGSSLTEPQMIVYESGKIYVGFIEDTGGSGIFIDIVRSTDSGASFPITGDPGSGLAGIPDGVEISTPPPAGSNFKIAADAGTDDVYVGYIDDGILKFVAAQYCDCADLYDLSFDPVEVNGSTVGATNMDMIKDDSNIYIVWEDNSSGTKEIKFAYSDENGDDGTWTLINISNTPSVSSTSPKLSVSGSNVYVTWIENTGINSEIHFRASNDSGVTFGSDMRLDDPEIAAVSATPQIASSGSNVYVVWADNVDGLSINQEIAFRQSSDTGSSFSPTISISSSSGESTNPRISTHGTNVHVVWLDKTIDAGNGELWFRSSSDSGETFGGLQIITESPGSYSSPIPNIDSSSTALAVAWKQAMGGGASFVKPAIVTDVDVSFDKIEFATTDVATITVKDASKSGTVDVNVIVNADPPNMVTLSETSPGIFSKTIDIDEVPHSASNGDVLKVTYPTSSGTFSAFSHILGIRSIEWIPDDTPLSNTKTYGVTVVDQSSNTNPFAIDIIDVPIITTNNAETTELDNDTLQIPETDLNSGVFSCTDCVVFMPGDLSMSLTDILTISISNSAAGDPGVVETITADVKTSSEPAGITITLEETTASSDVYSGDANLCDVMGCTDADTNTVYAQEGDFVEINPTVDGTRKVFGVVEPMLPTKRALIVNDNPSADDKVNLSFNGLSVVGNPREIDDPFAPGGGGGGISRAGIVFNAAGGASLFGGGGSGDITPPRIELGSLANVKSFDMPDEIRNQVETHDPKAILTTYDHDEYDDFRFPLVINSNGFALAGFENTIETQIVETNETVEIALTIYENSEVEHISLFTNLSGGLPQHSDTEIAYEKSGGISILDPNDLIDDVSFSITEDSDDDFIKTGIFEIVFSKPMIKSDIIVRSWDEKHRSMDVIIRNAIEVIPSESFKESLVIEEEIEIESEVVETEVIDELPPEIKPNIPEWIKTTTLWWSNDEITDDAFIKALQFLIQENILELPPTDPVSETGNVSAIPDWIRSTGSWWASGAISDDEFLTAIQYLVKNNIIVV